MAKEFDDVLINVGNYNKYQFHLTFWVVIVVSFFHGFSHLWVFITKMPKEYWCLTPGREVTNFTENEWKNLVIPVQDGVLDKCKYYESSFEDKILIISNFSRECSEWNYELRDMEETIGTSKNWFCDKELYSSHLLAAQMIGNSIGSALLPIIGDRFIGRRTMFFVCCSLIGFFTIPILFVDNISVILFTRFIAGTGNHAAYQLPLIICLELISPDKRAFTSFLSFAAWAVGSCTNGLVGWLLPNWWHLTFPTFVPFLGFFFLWWILPESPRYLLARERYDDCADVLLKIAKINKKKVSREEILNDLKVLPKDENPMSYSEILHNPRMIFNAIIISLISFAAYAGYMCVIYNVNVLPDNYFLGNFIISSTEIPSDIIALLFAHYLGRKATSILGALLLIPFCAIGPFFIDNPNVMLGVGCFIKIFNTIIIFAVYVITPELFPTPVRSSILGIVVLSGMIGHSITPYLITLEKTVVYWVLFGFSIAMLVLSLPLTETIGLTLPQTFIEADNHIKSRPLWKWINHWNKHLHKSLPSPYENVNGEDVRMNEKRKPLLATDN